MNNEIFTDEQLLTTVDFMIDQKLLDINTMIPCKIVKIKNDNLLDVSPLNKDVNANGSLENPPTIFNVPIMKNMGSNCLIDIELSVGDIGLVGFSHRDISSIVKQKKANKPPTKRMFSLSDGIWIGGLLKKESDIDNNITIKKNTIEINSKSNIKIISQNKTTIGANNQDLGGEIEAIRKVISDLMTATIVSPNGNCTPIGSTNPNLVIDLAKIETNLIPFKG